MSLVLNLPSRCDRVWLLEERKVDRRVKEDVCGLEEKCGLCALGAWHLLAGRDALFTPSVHAGGGTLHACVLWHFTVLGHGRPYVSRLGQ